MSTKGREPVFRVKVIIEEALFGGKKDRAFFIESAGSWRKPLRDRKTFCLCGKREVGSTSWRRSRPTDKVRREGIVLRLDNQSFFRVDVPLTHRSGRKVVAARGSKQGPPRGSEESTLDLELGGG